jgi:hypothetical protein
VAYTRSEAARLPLAEMVRLLHEGRSELASSGECGNWKRLQGCGRRRGRWWRRAVQLNAADFDLSLTGFDDQELARLLAEQDAPTTGRGFDPYELIAC